jgi:hypothetical protein
LIFEPLIFSMIVQFSIKTKSLGLSKSGRTLANRSAWVFIGMALLIPATGSWMVKFRLLPTPH